MVEFVDIRRAAVNVLCNIFFLNQVCFFEGVVDGLQLPVDINQHLSSHDQLLHLSIDIDNGGDQTESQQADAGKQQGDGTLFPFASETVRLVDDGEDFGF